MNMGFMLWLPRFVPMGCNMRSAEGSNDDMLGVVTCGSSEADLRARALANLQFSWILSGILIITGSMCLRLAAKFTPREPSIEYEQLHSRGADVNIAMTGFKHTHP